MSFIVVTMATPTEPPRYFGPFHSHRRAEDIADEAVALLGGYEGSVIELENFDAAWRATTWNEEKGHRV